jgi:hypothetical protein
MFDLRTLNVWLEAFTQLPQWLQAAGLSSATGIEMQSEELDDIGGLFKV